MKPDDILNAIGDVDDVYIRKAHQKSLLKATLIFLCIVILGVAIVYLQLPDYHLQLRYHPDSSVITEYIEPEVIIHNKWTSMEYTAYTNGVVASSTEFHRRFHPDYCITHIENSATTQIVGSNGDTLWPSDYLGSVHFSNLYLRTMYSTDLLDRIDMVFINSENAYGVPNQQLNCIKLEYLERSNRVLRQFLVTNGRTPEEAIIRSRGYNYRNDQISGWTEWDSDGTTLAYAEYRYDGKNQIVSTYLADGTLVETRISRYSFGNIKWREYYDTDGNLTGREVYHYRIWEPFICLEGLIALVIILSLAATMAIVIWDERIQPGAKLVFKTAIDPPSEKEKLRLEITKLNAQIAELSAKMGQMCSDTPTGDIRHLAEAVEKLNDLLANLLHGGTDNS